jgi:hypothetical protein
LALGACDTTSVPLSDFDTSCKKDQDCIVVQVGDACGCGCGNAAINVDSQAEYNSVYADRRSHCLQVVDCDCAATLAPVCTQGQCVFKGP